MSSSWEQKRQEFRENGAIRLEGLLNEHWLKQCREKFEWSRAHPSPNVGQAYGTDNFFNDLTSLGSDLEAEKREYFRELVSSGPFGEAAAQLCGSEKVFYYDHELFAKRQDAKSKTGEVGRTRSPFHQDTPYFNFTGEQIIAFWICLDGFVPKENCLQIVKGSHKGIMYDLTLYHPADDSKGLFRDKGKYPLPPIPNIEAQIQKGEAVELLSWELQTGDVVVFHPHALHGGGGTSPEFPNRRTLALRFFGDQAVYKEPPMDPVKLKYGLPRPWLENLRDGDPFWQAGHGKQFLQVWGVPPATAKL